MKTQLIRGLYNLKPDPKGCVLTIGNFDGVHLGHQALLAHLKEKAKKMGLPTLAITFEPLPKEFFGYQKIVPRLTRVREKFLAMAACQIDKILFIHFNQMFADMTAEDFIQKILIQQLNVKHILIGDDFRFGKGRIGDFNLLKKAGETYHFTVDAMPSVLHENQRISSTFVREALTNANHLLAKALLGHHYQMQGKVVHGDRRGRIIGFPTANIFLHRAVTPVKGVYAVKVYGIENQIYQGVANVGIRPTIGGTRSLLEVHLFDFNQEIYGKYVTVEFCEKLRDEQKFADLDLLKAQIFKDAAAAKEFFKKN